MDKHEKESAEPPKPGEVELDSKHVVKRGKKEQTKKKTKAGHEGRPSPRPRALRTL